MCNITCITDNPDSRFIKVSHICWFGLSILEFVCHLHEKKTGTKRKSRLIIVKMNFFQKKKQFHKLFTIIITAIEQSKSSQILQMLVIMQSLFYYLIHLLLQVHFLLSDYYILLGPAFSSFTAAFVSLFRSYSQLFLWETNYTAFINIRNS